MGMEIESRRIVEACLDTPRQDVAAHHIGNGFLSRAEQSRGTTPQQFVYLDYAYRAD